MFHRHNDEAATCMADNAGYWAPGLLRKKFCDSMSAQLGNCLMQYISELSILMLEMQLVTLVWLVHSIETAARQKWELQRRQITYFLLSFAHAFEGPSLARPDAR